MNIKYKKQKYKNGLRLWLLLVSVMGLGACAYDPSDVAESNSGEPQSRNLQDEIRDDLVVSERLVLKSYPEKNRRITILEGAVLATNGHPPELDAEEIVSFGGIIDTTPVDSLPLVGANGISDGLFHLTAKRGRGNLTIVSGGQNGAQGAMGSSGETGAKGSRGKNGAADYNNECWLSALTLFERDPGGPGRCHMNCDCSRQTGGGATGARGAIGKPGLAGGSGGAGGRWRGFKLTGFKNPLSCGRPRLQGASGCPRPQWSIWQERKPTTHLPTSWYGPDRGLPRLRGDDSVRGAYDWKP